MDGIFCNECGAELDESPTLLPEERSPCPSCGSLSRRFEKTLSSSVFLTDGGTASDELVVTKTGPDVRAQAGVATVTITAYDAGVQVTESKPPTEDTEESRSGQAVGEQRVTGRSAGARGPRRITDHLVVMGRSLWWTQLTEEPTWMVQVVDEAGEVLATGIGDDQIDALAGVADSLLPGYPG